MAECDTFDLLPFNQNSPARRRVRVARNRPAATIPPRCVQDSPQADSKRFSMPAGHWEGLPDGLLAACVLSHAHRHCSHAEEHNSIAAAARATCRQWRHAVDKNITQLRPSRWPRGPLARFPAVRLVDLSCLPLDEEHEDPSCTDPSSCAIPGSSAAAVAAAPDSHATTPGSSSPRDLLMGAAVLQSKTWHASDCGSSSADGAGSSGSAGGSSSDSGAMDCLVRVRATHPGTAALTCYVASRWPQAAPHITPAACLRIWRELPALPALQALAISGAMLLVHSVKTSVDASADAASGLDALLQSQLSGDDCSAVSSTTITHTYTLQLPPAVCQLTGLQALSVAWQLPSPDSADDNSATSSSSAGQGVCVLPGRRRSYEGPPCPNVVHAAHPRAQLPPSFSSLTNLRQLALAGSISGADALAPLAALAQLQVLALGPGELDLAALLQLRGSVVRQLRALALAQQAPWDGRTLAAVLAAAQQLQQLEIDEQEVASPLQALAIPAEQRLTEDDLALLAGSLTSLAWTTCAQRLCSGASLLGRNPAAGAAAAGPDASHAPGAWLGSLTSLRRLSIYGWQPGVAVLSSPVLEVLSSAVGGCVSLEQLLIHGLGVPMLPAQLAQLPALHTVSVASASMTRRMLQPAERALEVLGSCSGLRSLQLAGCELRQLPAWLLGLAQLTALQLCGNYLTDLPAGLCSLGLPPGLRLCDLSDNRLRELPSGIAGLSALQQLRLDQNYLSSLPPQVWQLPSLELLSARENMLHVLPELPGSCSSKGGDRGSSSSSHRQQPMLVAGAAGLDGLLLSDEDEEMVAGTGALHVACTDSNAAASAGGCGSAPAAAGAAAGVAGASAGFSSKLRELQLADNQLCQLPAGLSLLTALERLGLDSNQLRLPESGSLWCLTRLTALQLSHNHLKKLPAGLSRLQRLVELDVSGNHLPPSSCPAAAAAAAVEASSAAGASQLPSRQPTQPRSSIAPPAVSVCAGVAAVAPCSVPGAGGRSCRRGCSSSIASVRQQLPGPLRGMLSLQQLRMGGQHAEERSGHQCPLLLLLAGLCELVERLRALAPAHHQCPVTRAAAAAVARITAATSGKRGKKERRKQLLQSVRTEPGWLVVPPPKASGTAADAAAAGNAAAGGASKAAWQGRPGVAV